MVIEPYTGAAISAIKIQAARFGKREMLGRLAAECG
jgi:hypothetical protein